jgi:hypothetical protein
LKMCCRIKKFLCCFDLETGGKETISSTPIHL